MHRVNVSPVPPPRFSLLSRLHLSVVGQTEFSITAEELEELVDERVECIQRGNGNNVAVFDKSPIPVDLDFYRHPRPSEPLILNPAVPIYEINNSYNFDSGHIEEFCRSHPICIIRGLAQRLNFDLSLFSVDALSSLHPTMNIKVIKQTKQDPNTNKDENGNDTWEVVSLRGRGTLASHVEYMKKEEEKEKKIGGKRVKKEEQIRFGVANLSEHSRIFVDQLKELQKLPLIFRPGQPTDLLSVMGFDVDGLTGVYSFLKVDGVRTTAHEEDAGIPSINIGIGPGTSEWVCCELQHVKVVENECRKKGLVYTQSAIWPDQNELEALGVSVYRFKQLPGDLVHTGAGTLHWVQGQSMGSNVAWNCGPLSTQMIKNWKWQVERNRTQRIHSTVPLERTTWRIAEQWTISDENVLFDLRGILTRSLTHLMMVERWLKDSGVVAVPMAANAIDNRFDCDECQSEIFNMIFSGPREVNHCFECMMKNGGIQVHTPRQQRSMSVLSGIFDRFKK